VLWDNSAGSNTHPTAEDVSLLSALHADGVPIYFLGGHLVQAGITLPQNSRGLWTGLLHLRSAAVSSGDRVDILAPDDPLNDGPFGSVLGFKFPGQYDAAVQLGNGETAVAGSGSTDLIVAYEEPDSAARLVTQNLPVFGGGNTNSIVQRQKIFKNAVWWMLKLPPPPPQFFSLSLAMSSEPAQPIVGSDLRYLIKVRHSGELSGTGVTLTVNLPEDVVFVSATSPGAVCIEEDGVVTCRIGNLFHDEVDVDIVVRPTVAGTITAIAGLSADQPRTATQAKPLTYSVDVGK
jgi:hypothetical protein